MFTAGYRRSELERRGRMNWNCYLKSRLKSHLHSTIAYVGTCRYVGCTKSIIAVNQASHFGWLIWVRHYCSRVFLKLSRIRTMHSKDSFSNSVGQSALNHLAYAVMYTRLYSVYQYKSIDVVRRQKSSTAKFLLRTDGTANGNLHDHIFGISYMHCLRSVLRTAYYFWYDIIILDPIFKSSSCVLRSCKLTL